MSRGFWVLPLLIVLQIQNLDILLQVLDDGIITDGQGRTVSFKNSIIVLTSNLGSQSINDLSIRNENQYEIKKVIDGELKKFFKPEFLNRLDEIVIFNNLTKKELVQIAKIEFKNLEKRLGKKELSLKITDAAIDFLINKSFDHIYGARPLKRIIKKEIESDIANNILRNHYMNKKVVEIYVSDNKLEIN